MHGTRIFLLDYTVTCDLTTCDLKPYMQFTIMAERFEGETHLYAQNACLSLCDSLNVYRLILVVLTERSHRVICPALYDARRCQVKVACMYILKAIESHMKIPQIL